MNNLLQHRGYFGSVEFSAEDGCLIGKVLFINDSLVFDGQSVVEISAAFRDIVDDYLAFCTRRGIHPDQPFKGTFNVRLGPEMHRAAAVMAARLRMNLNELVKSAISEKLQAIHRARPAQDQDHVHVHYHVVFSKEAFSLSGQEDVVRTIPMLVKESTASATSAGGIRFPQHH